MKKNIILVLVCLVLVSVYILFTGTPSLRRVSDGFFLVGALNFCVGMFSFLLLKNYFKMFGYFLFYFVRTYKDDSEERKNVGLPYKKEKMPTPYEYENAKTRNIEFKSYLIVGVVFLAVSLVTAFMV